MIWLAGALLLLCALMPATIGLRRRVRVRGRRDATLRLYRDQAVELDRDLGEGRISATDHATALLEVQRRLLAAAETAEIPATASDRGPLILGLTLIPLAAVGLYLISGRPDLPAQPLAARMKAADDRIVEESALVDELRTSLAGVDPHSDRARQGEMMLGNLEASRGNFADAADAWRKALAVRFDPLLAAEVADAASRAEGRVSEASAALFRQALASAPPDAPWRSEVEQRLNQAASK
jgi:cytochrome c-type biogenesis protein CcmH